MKKPIIDQLEDAFEPIRSLLWWLMTRVPVILLFIWIIVIMVRIVLKYFP